MRSKGIHLSLALLVSMGAFSLSGCGGGDGDSARVAQTVDASKNGVTKIALADTSTDGYVHINGKLQFNLIGTDNTGKEINLNNKATWTLNDNSLGNVKNGLFTAAGKMGTGLVLSAAYAGLPTQTQDIVLSDANLTKVVISHPTSIVDVCKNTTLAATTTFSDGKSYDYPLTWALADSASAQLASFADETKPELSTKKSGVIKIIARGKDNKDIIVPSNELPFTIDNSLTKLTLTSNKALEMRQGQTATLTATGDYANSNSENIIKNASLTSSNTAALTVNATTGLITAVTGSFGGTDVTVSATCNGVSGTLVIKVTKPDIQKVEIVGPTSTTSTETLSVSVDGTVEPRIKVTYPTSANTDPEIYSAKNAEWEIINTPANYDSSKVTLDSETGKVTINKSWVLDTSITVTLSVKLLDTDNKVMIGSDGAELRDTIQLTINR
ncbi:hypothetical protein [Cellvibrio sp.]|jgi:hypothetical protein